MRLVVNKGKVNYTFIEMDLTNPVSQGQELTGGHVAEDGVEGHHDGGDAVEGPQCPQCGELTIVNRIEEGKN